MDAAARRASAQESWSTLHVAFKLQHWLKPHTFKYTPSALEAKLYSAPKKRQGSKIINVDELVATDNDDKPPSGLLRFMTSVWVKMLDCLILGTVLCTMFTAPLTFIWGASWAEREWVPGGNLIIIPDMLFDVIYLVYLVLRLNTSFMHPARRTEVVDRRKIRQWYLHSPLYWIQMLSTTVYLWIFLGAPFALNLIKVVRVVHLVELSDSLWRLNDVVWIRVCRPVFLLVVGSHWVACLMALVGGHRLILRTGKNATGESVDDLSWYMFGKQIPAPWSLYMIAFVESIYMLTGALDNPLGDGGPRNKSFPALVLVSIFGPVGCVVQALFISAVVREQAMKYALDMRHDENKAFLKRALTFLQIPKPLQWRVMSLHYYQKMSFDQEAFDELFNKKNLSPPLDSALRVYLYQKMLTGPLHFDGNGDPNYIIAVVKLLDNKIFLPGDFVTRSGEVGTEMFFLRRGTLEVLIAPPEMKTRLSKAKPIRNIEQGHYFGEIALVKETLRTAWIRAVTYVQTASLSRVKMEELWHFFPQEKERMLKHVNDILQSDNKRNARARWETGFNATKNELKTQFSDSPASETPTRDRASQFPASNAPASQRAIGPTVQEKEEEEEEDKEAQTTTTEQIKEIEACIGEMQTTMGELKKRQTSLETSLSEALTDICMAVHTSLLPKIQKPRQGKTTPSGSGGTPKGKHERGGRGSTG